MTAHMTAQVEVMRAGGLTTVQDLGRAGWAHLGVPRSGALDEPAARRANALVGNPPGAAVLETTMTGCALRFAAPSVVAVTGAIAPVTVDGRPVPDDHALEIAPGQVVSVETARAGVRSYVALAGGVDAPPVLGSRSTDTLSGLGPPRLTDGMSLPVGAGDPGQPTQVEEPGPLPDASGVSVRLRLGPRQDWLTADGLDGLFATTWVVSSHSNRVGARLDGPSLDRVSGRELPSEGIVLGGVQLPSDGRPLVFLADHPTTGGYPVVAVVDPDDLPLLAQARPGTPLRFTRAEGRAEGV